MYLFLSVSIIAVLRHLHGYFKNSLCDFTLLIRCLRNRLEKTSLCWSGCHSITPCHNQTRSSVGANWWHPVLSLHAVGTLVTSCHSTMSSGWQEGRASLWMDKPDKMTQETESMCWALVGSSLWWVRSSSLWSQICSRMNLNVCLF